MRDKIIRRNIIITTISLIVFYLLAMYISTRANRNTIRENLVNVSNIIISQLQDDPDNYRPIIDYYSIEKEWVEVIIALNDGSIIFDTTNDINYEIYNLKISEKDLSIIEKNDVDIKRTYINETYMYYLSRINDQYVCKTFIKVDSNISYILNTLFYLIIVLVFTLVLEIFFSRKTNKILTESFDTISNSLKTITTGDYKDIDTSSEYTEVREALKEISKINKNIYKYINELSIEEGKIVNIMNNMHQGLIILDGHHHVLLVNNYAERHLGIKINQEKELFEDIFKDENVIKRLNELSIDNDIKVDFYDKSSNKIYVFLMSYIDSKWDDESERGMIFISIVNVTFERKNEHAKEEFIANASHELKTPITTISGFSELLLSGLGETDDKAKTYIKRIYDESIRMKDTINELLYLSNLNSQIEKDTIIENLYLDEVIMDIVESMHDAAVNAKITLKTKLIPVVVHSRRTLIEHLLSNLISNGIKYNKENGYVLISLIDHKNSVDIIVEDSGIGISKENTDKVFERFYRVDKSHNRKTGGTGLGLAIVKKIVEVMNGKIKVESKLNVGTKFTITIKK